MRSFFVFILLWGMLACDKDLIGPQYEIAPGNNQGRVYILNEGNFGSGNGSVSRYDVKTGQIAQGVYQSVNGLPLGDIPQDMIRYNNEYWISVNNSGKIIICDTHFHFKQEITGLSSPRYLQFFAGKILCTDLYANGVHVIDPGSYQKTVFIPISDWTERLSVVGNECWISGVNKGRLYILNQQLQLSDSIEVHEGPGEILSDQNDLVWVMSSGGYQSEQPVLYQINPQNKQIIQQINFGGIQDSPGELQKNSAGDSLFFLSNGVWNCHIYNPSQFNQIYNSSHTYYAMKYLGNHKLIFTDAKNYAVNGWAYLISSSGIMLDSVECEIIPGTIFNE